MELTLTAYLLYLGKSCNQTVIYSIDYNDRRKEVVQQYFMRDNKKTFLNATSTVKDISQKG
jgi:hypothetical protein